MSKSRFYNPPLDDIGVIVDEYIRRRLYRYQGRLGSSSQASVVVLSMRNDNGSNEEIQLTKKDDKSTMITRVHLMSRQGRGTTPHHLKTLCQIPGKTDLCTFGKKETT